ncbi:dihydroxy-acid dehydratase domain-containing protein [Shumkonia mesophila]|uniref:dihydroxy-acid dehydratase domain-containing protein n=1 Tax=Shumkonia mesophila TaxID=2838854 RepID=UPI0029343B44|nr:dihydroxy-acid dehydratase [Shumkonia mesophila]
MVERPNFPFVIDEAYNPYRECIQGLANEPITVLKLLADAGERLSADSPLARLDDVTMGEVVARLRDNRPRIAIIAGSLDHPAHLLDRDHILMAAARVWQNGGVPFTFSFPVICDGTAQNNIGQSYSLASRNQTAAIVNVNFEGHSYHAAYVLAGCDKSPSAVLAGLAAADMARAHRGNQAPAWALFAPAHVLKGGTIPAATAKALRDVGKAARAAGHADLAEDIEENMHYILQCSSDEAFAGQLERALNLGLVDAATKRRLLDELAGATCHTKGGVCAFNGTGNSSRTLLAAFGLVPPELELLTDLPSDEAVMSGVDSLFGLLNKPQFRVSEILRRNFGNLVRIHNATGSSSNILLHLPMIMRHAGFDVTIEDYRRVRQDTPVQEVFAHSLTEGRDTFVLAQQFAAGQHRGMESLYRVLTDLGVAMDLDAPTVTGGTWRDRTKDLAVPVDPTLGEKAVIRTRPLRPRAGVEVLTGSFFDNAVVKVSGMSDALYDHFDDHVFVVRYYENEAACNADFARSDLVEHLGRTEGLDAALIRAVVTRNGGNPDADHKTMLEKGWLSFAFIIAGQGPRAYGMPEMFAPSQNLRHHRILESSSILMTDGRYSGVTKGACIGHTVPEAFDGGGIGYLHDGDVLRLNLSSARIDLLERAAFLAGEERPLDPAADAGRAPLFVERQARMANRLLDIAACNLMDGVTDAARGVVPLAVDRRATRRLADA